MSSEPFAAPSSGACIRPSAQCFEVFDSEWASAEWGAVSSPE